MKTRVSLTLCICILVHLSAKCQVKIGDNATTINSASLLELETTNKGFVLPRVSLSSTSSSSPLPAGLLTATVVYNTNSGITGGSGTGIYYWDGSEWNFITNTSTTASNYWSLTGNSGTSAGANFLGTTDGNALVFKVNNTSVGYFGVPGSVSSISLGSGSSLGSTAFQATAIGAGAQATANNSLALGYNSTASTQDAIGIGDNAQAKTNNEAIAIGHNSTTTSYQGISLGVGSTSSNNQAIAVGTSSTASGYQGIAIGNSSSATTNNNALAIGVSANATGYQSTAIGNGASATAQNSTAIGNGATTNTANTLILGNGANVGIGLSNPSYKLSVLSSSNPLYLSGVQTTSTFGSDSILTINAGIVKKTSYSSLTGNFWSLLGNSGTSATTNFIGTSDATDFVARTNNTERLRVTSAGNVGIGLSNPSYKLSVLSSSNPLYLAGVQATSTFTSDSMLTINAGIVKKTPYSSLTGNFWSTIGNSGTSYATNFLGTTDNVSLRMRTNNMERMVIDSTGSVGIGSTNFDPYLKEKLLVDYGNTTSNNIAAFKGNINDYLQIGVQNLSNGTNASSDFVATADDGTDSTYYIDMGINSSTYAPSVDNFGGVHDGYLYTYSRNLIIGTQKANSDIIFLSGGGQTKYNAVMRIDGPTGNIIIGKGENNTNATGNIIRGPNGGGTNITGGSLTLQGGSGTGTASGGYLYLNGGTTSTGTAGNIVMSTASSERLRIDQSGNVGIGISNPSYKLSVLSASNPLYLSGLQTTSTFTSDSLLLINAGVVKKTPFASLTGNFWSLTGNTGLSAANNFIGTTDATDVVVKTNNTERMHILGANNGTSKAGWTGMGITLPRSSLDVTGDFTNKNVITIQNTSSTGYSSVDMIDNSGNLKSTFGYGNSGTGTFFGSRAYFSTYGSDFVLTNNNSNSYNFFLNGTSGNIGINTSTPSEGLDVADKNIIISNSSNTAGLLKFQEPSSSGSNYVAFKAPVTSSNTTYTLPTTDGSANQVLTTNGSATLSWSSVGTAYSISSAQNDPASILGTLTYSFVGEVAVTTTVSDSLLIQGYFSAASPTNKYLAVKILRGTASGACGTCTTVAYSAGSQGPSPGSTFFSLPIVQQQSGLAAGTYYYKIYATGYTSSTANYNLTVLKVH
ncbi:MAG TPA: hypothetical protein VHD33_04610 [Legionellaceae bacterium]|nr:hypothetical protein [Legionellaceae bacterium]